MIISVEIITIRLFLQLESLSRSLPFPSLDVVGSEVIQQSLFQIGNVCISRRYTESKSRGSSQIYERPGFPRASGSFKTLSNVKLKQAVFRPVACNLCQYVNSKNRTWLNQSSNGIAERDIEPRGTFDFRADRG